MRKTLHAEMGRQTSQSHLTQEITMWSGMPNEMICQVGPFCDKCKYPKSDFNHQFRCKELEEQFKEIMNLRTVPENGHSPESQKSL